MRKCFGASSLSSRRGSIASVAVLVCSLAASASAGSISTVTFNWTGICADCTGTATGTLQLAGTYTLGTPITTSNFVSFTYNGTDLLGGFTITAPSFVEGMISNLPGQNDFFLIGGQVEFGTGAYSPQGSSWCAGGPFGSCSAPQDYGSTSVTNSSVYSQATGTPEPGTFYLLAAGGAALLLRRRIAKA